ncbi:MAG: hypothetical protein AAF970_18820 [Bacteroidota bacterium]
MPAPRRLIGALFFMTSLSLGCQPDSPAPVFEMDTAQEWAQSTHAAEGVQVRANDYTGGNFDVLGGGALLLQKADTTRRFWHTDAFVTAGTWTSTWLERSTTTEVVYLDVDLLTYGQPQDMTTGWTKFAGNPLIGPQGWTHNSTATLVLPDTLESNDQTLARGTGPYEGQWLLYFNVGGWAVGGWAAAVADSLAPLKRGVNPFQLADPYPLFAGNNRGDTLGYHAPNDWVEIDGTWYAPDESRNHRSGLWTSTDLTTWTNQGPIRGMQGHDPGLVYDGDRFYLFNEDDTRLQLVTTTDPLGPWEAQGPVLEVGDHTGDADVSFFNNAWHLFFDDAPHLFYTIGHAHTTPSAFPFGWQLENDVFGPRRPDQGQAWDEDTPEGNGFGTGDADIALEGTTLYLTYERPTGIAFKDLDLTDAREQHTRLFLEVDTDEDGSPDHTTEVRSLSPTSSQAEFAALPAGRIRIHLVMGTSNPLESPMIRQLRVRYGHR